MKHSLLNIVLCVIESGVLYLVPDSNGNGKRVVRKPHPPPTSPPLDEDFDAYTLETREPVTELGTVKDRPTSWAPTSPPLDEDFDAWTYTNTGAPITGTGTIYEEEDRPDSEEEWKEENVQRYGRSNSHRGGLLKRRNRQKLGRNYTSTVSKASGSGALHSGNREQRNGSEIPAQNDELGAGRRYYQHPSSEDHGRDRGRGEISERSLSSRPEAKFGSDSRSKVPKSHTGTSSTRIGSGNHRNGVRDVGDRSNLPLQRDNHHSRQTISRRGPAAHDYEVIDSHVLEEGPERTVTISTWREKVANEARRSEVAMSVYYLSADDYVGNDPGIGERDEFRAPTGQNGYMNGKGKVKQRDLLNDGWVRSKVRGNHHSIEILLFTCDHSSQCTMEVLQHSGHILHGLWVRISPDYQELPRKRKLQRRVLVEVRHAAYLVQNGRNANTLNLEHPRLSVVTEKIRLDLYTVQHHRCLQTEHISIALLVEAPKPRSAACT